MAASLYLTSAAVEAVTVPLDDLISFASDPLQPDVTTILTTRGPLRVLEDVETILRLLTDRSQ